MTTTINLTLTNIRTDGGTQPRAELDQDLIDEYATAMQEGAVFPPIIVFYDGRDYWLADGFHRWHAAALCGQSAILADIHQGTRRAAILFAASANAAHGKRRSNADKRRAVETLLRDEEWGRWSDAEIARWCLVTQPFVSKVRAELSYNGYKIAPDQRTVQRSDTTYTMNTTVIGSTEYVAIWQLEQGVRAWLAAVSPYSAARRDILDHIQRKTSTGMTRFNALFVSPLLPGPRRKGDVYQACVNVLEQLRQEERRAYPLAHMPEPSPAEIQAAVAEYKKFQGYVLDTETAIRAWLTAKHHPGNHITVLAGFKQVGQNHILFPDLLGTLPEPHQIGGVFQALRNVHDQLVGAQVKEEILTEQVAAVVAAAPADLVKRKLIAFDHFHRAILRINAQTAGTPEQFRQRVLAALATLESDLGQLEAATC